MKSKPILTIFWALVAVFILNILMMLLGMPNRYAMFIGFGVLFLLGAALLVLTIRQKLSGKPRVFLLLTGSAVVAMPVFAVLHNLVYAAAIKLFGADIWGSAGDEPFFFILAVIVCPLAFLAGAAGTIVLAVKDRAAA